MHHRSWLWLWLAVGCSACRQAPIELSPTPVHETAPTPATPVPAPTSAMLAAALTTPDPALARLPLASRLTREAEARPALAVRAEPLRAAVARRGVALELPRQVLASPVGARYCELAVTVAGLGVSVCEFADANAARAGSVRSRELFDALVPGRKLLVRDNTLLTLTQPADVRAERELDVLASTFGTLPATGLPTLP